MGKPEWRVTIRSEIPPEDRNGHYVRADTAQEAANAVRERNPLLEGWPLDAARWKDADGRRCSGGEEAVWLANRVAPQASPVRLQDILAGISDEEAMAVWHALAAHVENQHDADALCEDVPESEAGGPLVALVDRLSAVVAGEA
jgi:hypothetical protein